MNEYEVKGVTTSIKISSRASVKIGDSYYTVEYSEERTIPSDDVNMSEERQALWDVCNTEVDTQIEDIVQTFKNSHK